MPFQSNTTGANSPSRPEYDAGERMRVVLLGYVRPEMRFAGLQPLLERIFTDMAAARVCLSHPMLRCVAADDFLTTF